MEFLGRWLVVAGAIAVVVGLVVLAAGRLGVPLGRLPGDVRIERDDFRLYLPIATSLVVSGVLTLALWLLARLR